MKKVLISFSGGLDSTYLVQMYLGWGWKVDAAYTELGNNPIQTKFELSAIDNLNEVFKHKMDNDKNYRLLSGSKFTLVGNTSKIMLKQPIPWLVGMFYLASQEEYDEIAIGYVMNDDAVSWIEDIKKIWNSFDSLFTDKLPPLVFPLKKYKKSELLNWIDSRLLEHIVYCEQPIEKENGELVGCNDCLSCNRHNYSTGIKVVPTQKLLEDPEWVLDQ